MQLLGGPVSRVQVESLNPRNRFRGVLGGRKPSTVRHRRRPFYWDTHK